MFIQSAPESRQARVYLQDCAKMFTEKYYLISFKNI